MRSVALILSSFLALSLTSCETFRENPGVFCGGLCAIGALMTADAQGGATSQRANQDVAERQAARIEELLPAAERGDSAAQYELGKLYYLRDKTESWRWFCRAAMNNHQSAKLSLGIAYEYGSEPVEQNLVEAAKWYNLAGARGAEFRRKVAEKMSPEELAEADRLSTDWSPNLEHCERSFVQYSRKN